MTITRLQRAFLNRRGLLRLAAGGVVGAVLPAGPAAACRVFPADGTLDFTVQRNGDAIGFHRIRFAREGGRFLVRTDVGLEVRHLGAVTYRYTHHAEETWSEGWLTGLVSDTDDDGRRYRLRAETRGGVFQGKVNGAGFTVSGYIIPASLWHRDTPAVEALLGTSDGLVKLVRGRRLGQVEIMVQGRAIQADHFALSGEMNHHLWYDADCTLARVGLIGRDGSALELVQL